MGTITSISTTATTTVTATTAEGVVTGMSAAGSAWLGASVYGLLSEAAPEPDSGNHILLFSDEENEVEKDKEKESMAGSSVTAAKERCLYEAVLKHNHRLAHNVRMWRTVRQFLERTRQKRMAVCPPSVVLAREAFKHPSESFSLEDPISEYYADSSDVEGESECSSNRSSIVEETASQVDMRGRKGTNSSPLDGTTTIIIHDSEDEKDLDIIVSGSGGGGGGGGGGGEEGGSDKEGM